MKLSAENRSTGGKTCSSATLSTTNPTWTDPGWNPGLRGGRPAANRLSHGTAFCQRTTGSYFQQPHINYICSRNKNRLNELICICVCNLHTLISENVTSCNLSLHLIL
jgi:hypothetical protein